MRRVRFVLVAALLTCSTVALAQPSRSARSALTQPTKPARSKARPVKTAKPAANKPFAIPTASLLTQYQRVGRELMLLSNDQRAKIGVETADAKLACADLQELFRSIKLDTALKTAESRAEAAAVLADVHAKIQRLRGVELSAECLNNPLAKDCT